jgi:hypothetical protein
MTITTIAADHPLDAELAGQITQLPNLVATTDANNATGRAKHAAHLQRHTTYNTGRT